MFDLILLRIQLFQMSKFDFSQSYGRLLGVAYTALYRRLGKYLKEHNLPITPDQFRVLTQLWHSDGCSQQDLAVGSNRDRANVTRIIDILEREGIVERKNHETDRRAYRIFLTAKGKGIEKLAADCAAKTIEDALQGLTTKEIEIARKVLLKNIENLR
jgi:DNA-binding MarR family transcriptional regulator